MMTRDDDERRSSPFSVPLSSFHILDALNRSSDGGATLFLSKLNISDIGPIEALQLSNPGNHESQETDSMVERLALGGNQLTTLPQEFMYLSRLRYLNLKHNCFSTFPEVLTLIPLLDTLDISHNKIKALPARPGQLIHLRVLCISRNKLRRLPTYFPQFRMLDVLQVDRNPLEWPPKSEIDSCGDTSDVNKSKEWIRNLQDWIEINSSTSHEYDDSGYSEQPRWENDPNHTYDEWQFPIHQREFDAGVTPHARSLSIDSDSSMLSINESSHKTDANENGSDRPLWVPHLSDTHTASIGTIQGSRRDAEGAGMPSPTLLSASSSFEVLPDTEQMHLRAASYTSTLHKPLPKVMTAKKSLPDLGINKASTKAIPDLLEGRAPLVPHDEGRTTEESFNLSSFRKDSDSSSGALAHPEYIQASNSFPSLAMDCASYFRRSSTLTVNNSLPKSLVCLLESARSILFAMSKLYQTLEQYTHHGLDEELPSIFKKSLNPANMNISYLIRSLDRFDDVSQKARPSSAVCRAVAESCRDVVITMKKAVDLLILQVGLEPFNRRYSRWLILELYAITAEIALAWQAVVPYVDSLGPLLCGGALTHSYNLDNLAGPTSLINADQRLARLRPAETFHGSSGPNGTGRVRMTRRNAGSFSSKDVEIGKELPSYDLLPATMGRLATHTPALRIPKRQATVPAFPASSLPTLPSYTSNQVYTTHPRHISRSSLMEVSSSMSSTSESSKIAEVDKEAFQAVREALEVAPVVWDQIEEALGDNSANRDTQQILENARFVTRRLSDDVHAISGDNSESDKKAVGDSAHLFLKIFVQVSNILKSSADSGSISTALRLNMVKLTNLTEEFAILLHVSSLSASTARSTSPTSNLSTTSLSPHSLEDNQLSSSLSRARSAYPAHISPLNSTHVNGTHPTILTVPPKPLSARRLRHTREPLNESTVTDPG